MRPNTSLRCLAVAAALVVAGCGGGDESASTTLAPTTAATAPASTVPAASEPTVTTAPPATTAPPTTPAPTTAPTTVPPTAPPTAPPTTAAPLPDVDLTQFCFESEQVYLAAGVVSQIEEPTPAQAEAAISFLVFTSEQAVAAAPDGLGEEATRFLAIVRDIDELFDRYNYDVAALDANEDAAALEPLFSGYDSIITSELVPFLDEACSSRLGVLDDQAVKLAGVIDSARTWPLVSVTNRAGDIRLLVPPDWADLTGSADIDELTFLQATTDAATFESTWNVPGVVTTVTYVETGVADPALGVPTTAAAESCGQPTGVEPYSDAIYAGELYTYDGCAGVDTAAAVASVTNADADIEIVLEFQFPGGLDRDLLDQMLAGFAAGA